MAEENCENKNLTETLAVIENKLAELHPNKPSTENPSRPRDSSLERLASRLEGLMKTGSKTEKSSHIGGSKTKALRAADRLASVFGDRKVNNEKDAQDAATEGHRADGSGLADDLLSVSKESQGIKDAGAIEINREVLMSRRMDLPREKIGLVPTKDLSQYFAEEKKKIERRAQLEVQRLEYRQKKSGNPSQPPELTSAVKNTSSLKRHLHYEYKGISKGLASGSASKGNLQQRIAGNPEFSSSKRPVGTLNMMLKQLESRSKPVLNSSVSAARLPISKAAHSRSWAKLTLNIGRFGAN